MAKKIAGYIKLQVPAGQANPSPPIGPALGQAGLNIMEFCKAYGDRTFTFITKTPPASYFLKKAAGLAKGAPNPSQAIVGSVTLAQVKEIAEAKMADLNAKDMDGAVSMISGTARSMGIEVKG